MFDPKKLVEQLVELGQKGQEAADELQRYITSEYEGGDVAHISEAVAQLDTLEDAGVFDG